MKTKTSKKSVTKKLETADVVRNDKVVTVSLAPKKFFTVLAFIVLFGAILVLGAKKYKGMIIAGMVNGKSITRWELNKVLNDRYSKMTFDDLASNMLVMQLADQNGVVVTPEDLAKEISLTEERLGGKEALQSTLERMGYTRAKFENEMKTQVVVQKLASKLFDTAITDDEVKKFYDENKTLFPQKTLNDVKEDIKKNLSEQKLQQQFTSWFNEQKAKANIQSYL